MQNRKRGCRYFLRLFVFFIVSLLLVYFFGVGPIFGASEAYKMVHPVHNRPCCGTPADIGLSYVDAVMPSDDGNGNPLIVRGWYLPSRNRAAVIVMHGSGCNRMCVFDHARMFQRNGYGALVFDLRAHGDSDGETYRAGWKDVLAAVAFLQARSDVDRIGVWGFSLGGVAAIQGAAQSPDIVAVVVDGTIISTLSEYPRPTTLTDWLYLPYDVAFLTNWGLQANESLRPVTEAITQISPRPVLIIAADGEGGTHFEYNCAQALYSAAHEPKSQWIVPHIAHGGGFATYPQEYERRVIGFFERALRPVTEF